MQKRPQKRIKWGMDTAIHNLKVHFIGIGGVSMSSLALYLKRIGFVVSGSDLHPSEYTDMLIKNGIEVFFDHDVKNVYGANVVVYNSAIGDSNEELKAAKKSSAYVLSRAELLKMVSENFKVKIGVAGCHGKTTVTCMIAHILKCADKKFTAHIGGNDNKFGNFIFEGSEYFVSEVCEYKKNIDKFDADIAVCLNSASDHLECYNGEEDLIHSYKKFLERAKTAVFCAEDKNFGKNSPKNKATFALSCIGDYYPTEITEKNGKYEFTLNKRGEKNCHIKLNVYGEHNVINAVAACAAAAEAGIEPKYLKSGIESFTGTKRRFEKIGKINGAEIIADYAHHPDEIDAALIAVGKICKGRLFVVFQPHTYSRTLILKEKFIKSLEKAENLVIYKTFPAREEYIKGGSAYDLYTALNKKGVYIGDIGALLAYIKESIRKKDVLLVLGAGDLYEQLKARL